jgi:hypothetical protein
MLFLSTMFSKSWAGEGMWLPLFLGQLNEAEMKSMGLKISAEDIYSINKGSLKDAIVSFGGFCTGEIISNQGLVLTNHHCGFDAIQDHTTLENNYLRDGFWAYSKEGELQNPGLSATFIVRIEDVSAATLEGVTADMDEKARQTAIDKNLTALRKNVKKETWQDILIKPMFEGNQYFLFVTETYKDVRLVGAPPSSIGKFGADTDNWVWPRHTGDFSMFRIYMSKDGRPSDYSATNVPYKPKHSLPISLDGVEENDFTMVYGFPGRTQEYLPSQAVAQTLNKLNPAKIAIRDKALKIMDADMRADEQVKIKYASKYASISNAWKKWLGESLGLKKSDAIDKKMKYEQEFQKLVNANPEWKAQYGNILPEFERLYKEIEPYNYIRDNYRETFGNTQVLSLFNVISGQLKEYDKKGQKGYDDIKEDTKFYMEEFFMDFNEPTDRKVFDALMTMYFKNIQSQYIGTDALMERYRQQNSTSLLTDKLFNKTILTKKEALLELLNGDPKVLAKKMKKDPMFSFLSSIVQGYDANVATKLNELQPQITRLQRQYMKAQMEVFKGKKQFYPDANSTMRLSYGKVQPFFPRDGIQYQYYTYLDGVMEKYVPKDYEFDVPQKLRELYLKKDYGQYATKEGRMPVCFIGSNHTTGGNSGSPAIDAYGNLIGLNFDRAWEGTMSDINYDVSLCRNIMVDTRYILFIVDKYAGAKNIIEELNLVHPKELKN